MLIDTQNIPKHVAIIMDGNGRWAQIRGKNRLYGHKEGVSSVRQVVEAAAEMGVEYLTLYAFSTENWNRPKGEVLGLMKLLTLAIANETKKLNEHHVRLHTIGNTNALPSDLQKQLKDSVHTLSKNTGLKLILALSYGGRWELINTMKQMCRDAKSGALDPECIDNELVEAYLTTHTIPDPDLLIRTSGEQRISNFLLWQLAYTEFYFTPVLWPDFRKKHLQEAIKDFQVRNRRFGKVCEPVAIL